MTTQSNQFEDIINGKGEFRSIGEFQIKELHNAIKCKDGTTLSVQASRYHYCTPRTDTGPYTHVEIGYPSNAPSETWAEYYDGEWTPENATDSVYGYVPIELVIEFIDSHGGEDAIEKK